MAQATMSTRARLLCASVVTTAVVIASIWMLSSSSADGHALALKPPAVPTSP